MPGAFVYGDNFWFTATALCQRANEPLPMTLSPFVQRRMRDDLLSDAAPVRMQHRMVYARYSSDMQVDISFPVAVSRRNWSNRLDRLVCAKNQMDTFIIRLLVAFC